MESLKKDDLEQFIANNRNDFDSEAVPMGNWEAICEKLSEKEQKNTKLSVSRNQNWKRYLGIAASVILLISVGAFGGIYYSRTNQMENEIASKINPEYNDTENFYIRKVSYKLNELSKFQQNNEVKNDLDQIDLFIQELKKELLVAPKNSKEQIVKNMIANYQIKLDILDKVLQHVQNNQQDSTKLNDQKNEKIEL
ncbi:MAG: hypothetical protein IPL95_00260 [Saprospiraceae bacterium]|nr:hypothetical protein [Saprospiraceae bacterium]